MAVLRRYRRASGLLAIVALLVNVLSAFVPAKAAPIVDDVLGQLTICTADGHDGTTPASSHATGCPSCVLEKPEALEKLQQNLACACVPSVAADVAPRMLGDAYRSFGTRALGVADYVKLGGNPSRAPPLSA